MAAVMDKTTAKVATTLVHPKVTNNKFATDELVEKSFASDEELLKYYSEQIRPAHHDRVLEFYRTTLTKVVGNDSAIAALHANDTFSTKLPATADEALMPLGLSIADWNYFSSQFYQDKDFKGRSITIGGKTKKYDYRTSLDELDNKISSVDTGKFVPATVLFEHPFFQGERLILLVDSKDLSKKKMSDGRTWNNQASSIAVGVISLDILLKILAAIASGGAVPPV